MSSALCKHSIYFLLLFENFVVGMEIPQGPKEERQNFFSYSEEEKKRILMRKQKLKN